MRTKVLASKDSDSLEIEVVTVEESQLDQTDLSAADFIYICGDTTKALKPIRIHRQSGMRLQTVFRCKKFRV